MAQEQSSRYLIRSAREKAGLTQAELAAIGKTSQAAVSAYESGRRSPSVNTLSRLLAAAGFELRLRMTVPDSHDVSRIAAEKTMDRKQLASHAKAEATRLKRHARNPISTR